MEIEELPSGLYATTMEINGQLLKIAVRPVENSQSPPLLIFNGIGANMELFEPFVTALSTVNIIIFDAPGVGGSDTPLLPYRFNGLARLATNVLDHFGYSKVDVIGVSWGGALAQVFAKEYPDRCRRLILAATSTGAVMVPGNLSVIMKLVNPKRYYQQNYMEVIAEHIYGGDFRENPELVQHLTSMVKASASKGLGYYWQLLAGLGWTSIHWLHKIKQPTLILAGDDDPIIPLINAEIMHWRMPNSRLEILDCGHLFLLTRINTITPLIEEFLLQDFADLGIQDAA